ncbi:MAG: FecR domain-containing protein [Sphingopyxis sp.]|uniref:FecR family protein n=1 Tax=Sphingopyxis sp. TaxID=1908224 RepID=UPI0032ECB853
MVTPPDRSERIAAEAAAWLARLESTGRSAATEPGLQAWLVSDDAHRRSFERAMDAWAIIPGAAQLLDAHPAPANDRSRLVRALALAASLVFVLFAAGWWLLDQPAAYSTAVGEQKIATLEDGTRIALNAETHLSVRYDRRTRSVRLDSGEAMFEVKHNPKRPFRVEAGDKTVTALGTSFLVRKVGDAVVVTLISGKVRVDTQDGAARSASPAPVVLAPGERLIAAADSPEIVTRTSSEAATAWRRGQVVFEDTTLSAAIAELNHYGGVQIDVADPRLGGLLVSGVFATNDAAEFASAVAVLHGLEVKREDGRLRLSR